MNDAPTAGEAPDLSAGTEILKDLLVIERERLVVAREIESRTLGPAVASYASNASEPDDDVMAAFLDSIQDG